MPPAISSGELAYMKAHINQSLQPNLIASTAICVTAAYIAIVLRFVSRSIGRVEFGKDDFFVIIAMVCSTLLFEKSISENEQLFSSVFSLIMVSCKHVEVFQNYCN